MRALGKMPVFFALVALQAIMSESQADLFGPGNFDECVTDSMKGVTSDVAARAIYKSCESQFPDENRVKSQPLNNEQLSLLTGNAGLEGGVENPLLPGSYVLHNRYGGFIYNGNPDITVTEVTVSLAPKGIQDARERLYLVPMDLKPLSRSNFSF